MITSLIIYHIIVLEFQNWDQRKTFAIYVTHYE